MLLLWEGKAFATASVVSAMPQAGFAGGGRVGRGNVTVENVVITDKQLAGKATAWASYAAEHVTAGETRFTDARVRVGKIAWKVPIDALAVAVKET